MFWSQVFYSAYKKSSYNESPENFPLKHFFFLFFPFKKYYFSLNMDAPSIP